MGELNPDEACGKGLSAAQRGCQRADSFHRRNDVSTPFAETLKQSIAVAAAVASTEQVAAERTLYYGCLQPLESLDAALQNLPESERGKPWVQTLRDKLDDARVILQWRFWNVAKAKGKPS